MHYAPPANNNKRGTVQSSCVRTTASVGFAMVFTTKYTASALPPRGTDGYEGQSGESFGKDPGGLAVGGTTLSMVVVWKVNGGTTFVCPEQLLSLLPKKCART